MERRRGIVVRRDVPAEIGEDLELRKRISETMIDALAALHAVDIQASGIERIGKPAGFVERQIGGWAERRERSRMSQLREVSDLTQWLLQHVPESQGPPLVHYDFKRDNVMLAAAVHS